MPTSALDILQVSTADVLGGAERVAYDLCRMYHDLGHHSYLAVGRRHTEDARVLHIRHDAAAGPWRRVWWKLHARLATRYSPLVFRGAARPEGRGSSLPLLALRHALRACQALAEPRGWMDARRGIENLHFPGTWRLLDLPPHRPDILHCHNLHGGYFDLRALPALSREVPVVLTLHDAWLFAGHCAHAFECTRWMSGCGQCPDLSIYPAVRCDATAENWRRKADIFARCRLHVAAPSRWLLERAHQSLLGPAIAGSRVIPNGVDLAIFKPGDRAEARAALGLPHDADILLFAAYGGTKNPFKDGPALEEAVARIGGHARSRSTVFISLGEVGPSRRVGHAELRRAAHQADPRVVAEYYRAADLYIHAARADTFPTSIIEAMACGTPVVATAVGGIVEQVSSLDGAWGDAIHAVDGILVPPGSGEALARASLTLLDRPVLRRELSWNAAERARRQFDLTRQAAAYLAWYDEILGHEPVIAEAPGRRSGYSGSSCRAVQLSGSLL